MIYCPSVVIIIILFDFSTGFCIEDDGDDDERFIYLFIYFAGTNIQTNEEVAIKLVSAFNQLGFVLY